MRGNRRALGDKRQRGFNTGERNDGWFNIGDSNAGDGNKGGHNTGRLTAGSRNSGFGNSGSGNIGHGNSGHDNRGDHNAGNANNGNSNVGQRNAGDCNTGDGNIGRGNAGDGNPGFGEGGSLEEISYRLEPSELYDAIRLQSLEFFAAIGLTWRLFYEKAAKLGWKADEGGLRTRPLDEVWSEMWAGLSPEAKSLVFTTMRIDPRVFHNVTGMEV
jgi:hypothetical protein